MKKHLLLTLLAFICVSMSAANLNPFAYGLKSTLNEATMELSVEFNINAPATSVKVYAVEVADRSKRYELYSRTTNLNAAGKISFTKNLLEVANLPQGVDLTWEVDVKGKAVESPTFVKRNAYFFCPTSLDIDNNPENANFGTIFCIEARPEGKTATTHSYLSKTDGAGLYVFNADGSARPIPNQNSTRYGYNGGKAVMQRESPNKIGNMRTYSPYRVRVSDCGRIFISAMNNEGYVLFEANGRVFSEPNASDWGSITIWKDVISIKNSNTTLKTTKYTSTDKCTTNHSHCNIYNLYNGTTFIAGPNISLDVRGSGEDLQLLMLSGCQEAIDAAATSHYYCSEYNLGEATMWNTAPSRNIPINKSEYICNYVGTQVQYDKDGGVWLASFRSSANDKQPGLVHFRKDGTEDFKEIWSNVNQGGIRFNDDFTLMALAGNNTTSDAGVNTGKATIYAVTEDGSGKPVLTKEHVIDMSGTIGKAINDFAFDYAGNLYACGNVGEQMAVWAMPRSADDIVSTPAADKYQFTVACQKGSIHTVTINCYPNDGGTVTASINGNARVGLVLDKVPSCSNVTLTADPDAAYRFVSWTINNEVVSTDPSYTFYVTKDITIQANFEGNDCTNITWWNLLANGEEVEERPHEENGYPGTNERIWRWFQVEYGKFKNIAPENLDNINVVDHTKDNVTSKTEQYLLQERQFNVTGFSNNNGASFKDFLAKDQPFKWLGDYIYDRAHNLTSRSSGTKNTWAYYMYLFINRTDYAINWVKGLGEISNWAFNGTNGSDTGWGNNEIVWDSFIEYGKMEHWRPYWTRIACGLPSDMKYGDYTPITWTKHTCAEGTIQKATPSGWMQWNEVWTELGMNKDEYNAQDSHILAWRKGSTTGPIVTRIQESNLALYATYVKKNINENGGVNNPENHSATNADVIKLMQNENYREDAEHAFTVTRPLQAGMYNTICLPFSLSSLDGTPLAGATVMEFTGVDKNLYNESGDPVTVLNFTQVTSIEAGKPYLIKLQDGASDIKSEMQFKKIKKAVLINEPAEPITQGAFTFQGTFDPTNIPAGSLILVANNRLAINTAAGEMKGLRGYFTIDPMAADAADIMEQAANGRVYLSIKKPVTTSVPLAPEAEKQTAPEVKKVMYDGKIYILRGNEVYSITGQRVQ